MENQPNQDDQSPANNVVDIQSPDRKVTRRKFVQTTLFPLKSHDAKLDLNSSQKEAKKVEIVDDKEDEEVCGGKKKRGRKPKGVSTTPQKRGSKKLNDGKLENCSQEVEEVVVVNGDEEEEEEEEEVCGSQGKKRRGRNLKGSTTPSKRRTRKATANGKDASVVAIDDIESPDEGTPQQLKGKQRISSKNGKTTQQVSQAVPDLWLEAKQTAEENSRIFAGKQIHPFFSSWKAGRKELDTIEAGNSECLGNRKQKNVEIGPVHVFEDAKDNLDYIDWSNWSFNDSVFSNPICNEERKSYSVEATVSLLNPSRSSPLLKDVSLAQLCDADGNFSVISTSMSPIVVDEEDPPDDPQKNGEKDSKVSGLFTCGNVRDVSSQLQERSMSYYCNRGNHPENSLWTNKYHPEKASEVCGNSEAVKSINDWLHLWHATDFRFSKSSYSDRGLINDNEYDSYDSDSDIKYEEEATGLKNVLLVTGPVGSGKSAAIYACAKEQGFQVIEVNASDWRNGALLKQKFGEAVGSHWLKRSQESPMGKHNLKSSPVSTSETAAQDLNNGVAEVISLLEEDEDCVGNVGSQYHSNGRLSCDKGDIKTLILFEDVDVTLCDDRGFISTIQQLAATGKRPMILTSNNESPMLPDNLDREEVCFAMPSVKELTDHINLVCSAENANIWPKLVERCVEFCKGDIRKTLMHLQFWCQSKQCIKNGKMRNETCPMMFNLDAGHCILPKLIPWELPSLLSKFVEAEVSKSFSEMEEDHSLLGVIEEEEEETGYTRLQRKQDSDIGETESIEAKKEAIINGNCFLHVDNDIMAISNTCEFSNISDSPVAFTRRNIRRKSDTVLSESEDEICNNDNKSAVFDGLAGSQSTTSVPTVHPQSPFLHSALKGISNEFSEQLLGSGVKEVEAAKHQTSDTRPVNLINFFALGNSCSQSTDDADDLVLHSADANHDCLEFPRDFTCDRNTGVNMQQCPVVDHEKCPTVGNSRNQSAVGPFHCGELIGVEIGMVNAANLCLKPLSDRAQHYGEEKVVAKRCLFPHPAHVDPTSGSVGSPSEQSTGQLTQCVKTSMTEPHHWRLKMVTESHDGPLSDQLPSCTKVSMENSEQQHLATGDSNPLCYTALKDSLNPSNDQLFHFIEAKMDESKHQLPKAGDRIDDSCTDVYGLLNQSCDQFLGINTPVNIQQQHPQIVDLNHPSFSQLDAPLSQTDQLLCIEERVENADHQLSDRTISCPAVDNSLNPLDEKVRMFTESKAEEHQSQYSDATNMNHEIDQCPSFDMSVVPESTFVPETEINGGAECPSVTDLMEIMSPVVIGNGDSSIPECQPAEFRFRISDLNVNPRDEEMGDSHNENGHLEPSTSGCQMMDECSRMNFYKESKNMRIPALEINNSVQERWDELRKTDLGQYILSENKDALRLVELNYRMSDLISEGDLLLRDCELLINDASGMRDETFTFGWLDQQDQIAFSIAQYGYLLYAKDIESIQSKMGLANKLHLGWEMLVSTSNPIALGKLLSLNRSPISSSETSINQVATTINVSSSMREREICLQNIVQSVVPLKSCLAARGNALHDYLNTLAHISRSEASRLAEAAAKCKRRRVRVAKNYLSNRALDLSEEDILKLSEYNFYQREIHPNQHDATDASLR